jgi:hypothetical protein
MMKAVAAGSVDEVEDDRYQTPSLLGRGRTFESPLTPGLSRSVDDLLGLAED